MIRSPNFSFLAGYDPLLLELAAAAERYFFADPEVALIRLRLLGDTMALQTVAVAELDRLDQSLLGRAFSGTLVPQDPTDEPAAATVARQFAIHHKRLGLANARA